jgi:hypothetical protein
MMLLDHTLWMIYLVCCEDEKQPKWIPLELPDAILLTTYLVLIGVALFKIADSFNDEYTVKLDEDHLKAQLEAQKLQGLIGISCNFEKRYEMNKKEKDDNDKFKQFGINIENKSNTHSIYVDWDYCTLTDLMGRSRRVTRLVPGSALDLFQVQPFSSIAPKTTLKETITAEDVLKRNESKDFPVALKIEVDKALLDFVALSKGKDPEKKRYARFDKRVDPLEIFLDLALRFIGPTSLIDGDRAQIRCRLELKKLPWKAGLPWNPK